MLSGLEFTRTKVWARQGSAVAPEAERRHSRCRLPPTAILPRGRPKPSSHQLAAAERFIRTLKEHLLWGRRFDTIEALRLALLEFTRTYNEQWMLEKSHDRSPAQVRRDLVGLAKAA